MPELDTQIPAWLQRNWAPLEPTDLTPWLNERYRRQVEQQKLPLQLQEMALKNEASRLDIEHQGMVNQVSGMDLQFFKDDLPKIKAWNEQTGGDPIKMTETPPPVLNSVRGQKIVSDQIAAASQVGWAARRRALEAAKFSLAAKAAEHGQEIPMTPDPLTGQPTFAFSDITSAFNQGALRDLVGKAFLEQAKVSPSQANIAAMDQAKSDLAAAQATGDPAKIQAAQQHLQSVMAFAPGQQITVFDPVTGKPTLQMGRQDSGDLTKGMQTEQQKHLVETEQAIGDLLRTRDQLGSANVVGAWPTVQNKVFDKILGNIAPEFVNKERVAGRAAVDWTKQDLINHMRQRFGERAVERLGSVLPSTGLLESPENARIVTDELIKTMAEDAARRSLVIGKPPAEHVLRALSRMSNDELDKEISSGYLPPSVAIAAVKIRKLPPGQMPPGMEEKATGTPMIVAPGAPATSTSPRAVSWDQLFQLYKSGKLGAISGSPAPAQSDSEDLWP